jgi:hypothetical protein
MRKPRNIETSEDEFGYWEQTDDGPVWHRTNEDGTPYEEESDPDFIPLEQMEAEDGDDGDDGDEDFRPHSVVAGSYKAKYRTRARERHVKPKGVAQKALERSCGDWLAVELAKRILTEGKKPSLRVAAFEAILDANGVKHLHWNRTTPGWQGRLRMTGRLALQRIVAENGTLVIPGEGELSAPKAWCDRVAR